MKSYKFSLMTPMNLSYWWNIGSLLGVLMMVQIMTGIMLVLYYDNSDLSFISVMMIHLEINFGYLFHIIHLGFSNYIFIALYLHMIKGLLNNSFTKFKLLWISGCIMMVMIMMIAFLGYVLPWGQMSLWGATVITNLLSVLPYGSSLVKWVWGGYFVSNFTLKIFFCLHFLLPIVLIAIIVMHLIILHYSGSSNPLGLSSSLLKLEFAPAYVYKDLLNIIIIMLLILLTLSSPYLFSDPDNFIKSNSMVSPIHIKPEWYFLQYYAILRSIPSKLGGIICFIMSVLILFMLIFLKNKQNLFSFKVVLMSWSWYVVLNLLLMWLGGCPVEYPFIFLSQILSALYFIYFMLFFMLVIMINF
uniref:Cytochrome b n=1 Tax=Diximermis spiculatus TaxID=3313489 RepID=Q1HBB5_9BILA|nr:cytochrome b [Strelkovimermis spiculatus]ABF48170.1 cytochrome b [Strelkovimermis spiculatus]ABF48182.1 cytochrome b [Strelkovimermis spiculatus]